MDPDLSIVSEEEDLQGYITSEGEHVHTNTDDDLQLLPKETNLNPETGIDTKQLFSELRETTRTSERLPFAEESEKIVGVPYYSNVNKK